MLHSLRVRLADDGTIDDVERIGETGNGAVWTPRDGQHNGFPGLKTDAGLLPLGIGGAFRGLLVGLAAHLALNGRLPRPSAPIRP